MRLLEATVHEHRKLLLGLGVLLCRSRALGVLWLLVFLVVKASIGFDVRVLN